MPWSFQSSHTQINENPLARVEGRYAGPNARLGIGVIAVWRTQVHNEEWEQTFRRWYPGFRPKTEEQRAEEAA